MGSKAQRKKERHARKRKEKRKKVEQARYGAGAFQHSAAALGSNARHRLRLQRQVPQAWPGETPADAAVFDDGVLAALPSELAQQALDVRKALEEASEARGAEALQRTSTIARSSPFGEWRLFVRGLVDWLANDVDAANEAWKRLNPERRPGRIATAMTLARRTDLERLPPATDGHGDDAAPEGAADEWLRRCDDRSLFHAKLLRRVRFDRAALRVAKAGLNVPEESRELLLGPKKIEWLRRFVVEYGDTEPGLAAALSQAALGRAFRQDFDNLFEQAAAAFEGPPHDRQNRLLTFFYYCQFDDAGAPRKAEQALQEYLKVDLPQNESLTRPLRDALASTVHLNEARVAMRPPGQLGYLERVFGPPEDAKAIRGRLRDAELAYPANREAWKTHVEWIEAKLNDERLNKAERTPFEKDLAGVMRNWSRGLPNDVEPRLWLVDHLFENDEIEEARPHVDFLANSRHGDPRVRATPWKWQLLEAMRLCRRKTWLPNVPARLEEAEKLWPTWLSKRWLPYLHAAWLLRSGRMEEYEAERRRIADAFPSTRDSLADACMMLGAAQKMRASADELKSLRAPVEERLRIPDSLSLDELLEAGSFFWDLHRTRLVYPAYRTHGKTIGKTLLARATKERPRVLEMRDDERFQRAMLWCSDHRFWSSTGYDLKVPDFFVDPALERHPTFVACRLHAFLKGKYRWGAAKQRPLGALLRAAAPSARDAYDRHWFVALADELDDAIVGDEKEMSRFRSFAATPSPTAPEGVDEYDDDELDEDGLFDEIDFDPPKDRIG